MGDSTEPRRSKHTALALATLAAIPLTARFVALAQRNLSLTWRDLLGIVSDLGTAAVGVTVISAMPRRWLRALAGCGWGVLHWAHLEHVVALDAPLSLRHAGYLSDPEFLFGSALRPITLLPGVLVLGLGLIGGSLLPRIGRRYGLGMAAAGATVLGLLLLLPGPHSWRSRHFVVTELGRLRPDPETEPVPTDGHAAKADLSGERLVPVLSGRPNVLLLVLESVSGTYLPGLGLTERGRGLSEGPERLTMPRLDRLLDETVSARLVFTHQRQTNRGLWALLCGRLPDLASAEPKLTELSRSGDRMACLPEAFRRSGYRTLFQQAAPLSFMVKDEAMTAVGFEEVRGDESLSWAYRRSFWGVDDRAFLEQSAGVISELEEERERDGRPWFLTLLTVGTHHPFTVPSGEESYAHAVEVLDDAVGELVAELGASGVLDETLLVITSDESGGLPTGDDWSRELSQNLGLLMLRYPDARTARLERPVAHRDTAATILDAIGLAASSTAISGRSILRRQIPRPIFFANGYLDRTYGYFPPDRLVVCGGGGRDCRARKLDPRIPLASEPMSPAEPELAKRLARSVDASSLPPASLSRRWSLELHPKIVRELSEETKAQMLFMGQNIHLPADTALDLELDFEILGDDGWVHMRMDLLRGDRVPRVAPWISRLPVLGAGDRARISVRLITDEAIQGLQVRGYLNVLFPDDDLAFAVHRADLVARPLPEGSEPGVRVREVQIDRAERPPNLHADLADLEALPEGQQHLGDSALEAMVETSGEIVGPQLYVPRDSRILVEATVEALEGVSDVRLALGSPRYELILGRTEPRSVLPQSTVDLELEVTLDATLSELGPVLFVIPREKRTRLLVHRLRLEAELP